MKVDKVFIVGDKPEWFTGEHIHAEDNEEIRYLNSFKKLEIISNHKDIPEDFVLFHDDFFLLKDYKPIKYYDGNLWKKWHNVYEKNRKITFLNTIKKLTHNAKNYALHYPMPMNKTTLRTIIDEVETQEPYSFYCLYGNLDTHYKSQSLKDNKVLKGRALDAIDYSKPSFSTHEEHEQEIAFFESMYPNKSPFEI